MTKVGSVEFGFWPIGKIRCIALPVASPAPPPGPREAEKEREGQNKIEKDKEFKR